jgi:hypothetical protein
MHKMVENLVETSLLKMKALVKPFLIEGMLKNKCKIYAKLVMKYLFAIKTFPQK